jgi:hypothetical protein
MQFGVTEVSKCSPQNFVSVVVSDVNSFWDRIYCLEVASPTRNTAMHNAINRIADEANFQGLDF